MSASDSGPSTGAGAPSSASKAPRWPELDRRRRRRLTIRTAIELTIICVVLFGSYYLIPFTDSTSAKSIVRLVVGIAAFVLVLAWQLRQVTRADMPYLRAVRALGSALPLFLLVFAIVYLSLSQADPTHFSEPLNHTGALYLVITVFSTVGFGDITPKGDLTRLVVSLQMLLDLVVLGTVVRLLTTAAKGGPRGASTSTDGS